MTLPELLLLAAALVAIFMLAFWLVSLPLRNASIIDIGWGLGFVLVAWGTYVAAGANGSRALLLVLLPTFWGVRLSAYLAWRNHGHGEDRRYVAMRSRHGDRFWWVSLFTVFALQGVVMWIVALPLVVGLYSTATEPDICWWHVLGVLIWLAGLVFEAGGDWQLARFKADSANHGKVMDHGLWRYTRHPNYFGDFCVWWGHWLVALAMASQWWTIVSPLVMSTLLIKYSGVGLLESDIEDRRPEYADYKRRTSAFFPRRPR